VALPDVGDEPNLSDAAKRTNDRSPQKAAIDAVKSGPILPLTKLLAL